MGMDVYIEPEWTQNKARLQPLIEETRKSIDKASSQDAERLREELRRLYDEVYGKFYFRTQYNPYGLHHWLQANVGQGAGGWGLSIFQSSTITKVDSLRKKLLEVKWWIEMVEPMKTSVLWVTKFCEDWSHPGLQTRNDRGVIEEKLVQLSEEETQYYKEWLNELKEFLDSSIESALKGGKVVISR